MKPLHNHIILIGFKHVGKTAIGLSLAKKLQLPFYDTDQLIEMLFEKQYQKRYSCKEIMFEYGEPLFRQLELSAIKLIIDTKPSVISLGGGAAIQLENQRLIESSILVHVTAPRGIVYERIVVYGRPAFFNPDEDVLSSFNKLWKERDKTFTRLKDIAVNNNSTVDVAVNKIIEQLQTKGQ